MLQQTQPVSLKYLAQYILSGEDWRVTAVVACTVVCIAVMWVIAIRSDRLAKARVIDLDAPVQCGDITAEHMSRFNGTDPFLPLYLAIRGRVYDVTKGRDFYGPGVGEDGGGYYTCTKQSTTLVTPNNTGGAYAVFAGRECARALALMSTSAADCNDNLVGLTEQQLQTLAEWESKFQQKYGQVGQIVAPKELTLAQLATHNGIDPSKPLYLAIQGIIYDVSKGGCISLRWGWRRWAHDIACAPTTQGVITMGQTVYTPLQGVSVRVLWPSFPPMNKTVWPRLMT